MLMMMRRRKMEMMMMRMTRMMRMRMGKGEIYEKQTPLVKWDDANLIATSFTTSYQHLIL